MYKRVGGARVPKPTQPPAPRRASIEEELISKRGAVAKPPKPVAKRTQPLASRRVSTEESEEKSVDRGVAAPKIRAAGRPEAVAAVVPEQPLLLEPLPTAAATGPPRGPSPGLKARPVARETEEAERGAPYRPPEGRAFETGFGTRLSEVAQQLELKHLEEVRQLRRTFEAELEHLRAEMEAKRERELQRIQGEMNRREALCVAAARESATQAAEAERDVRLEHLLDVNAVARSFLAQAGERENLLRSSIDSAKRNEERYLSRLGQCVPFGEAVAFVRGGLAKGRALQIFLGVGHPRRDMHHALERLRLHAASVLVWRRVEAWRQRAVPLELGACSLVHVLDSALDRRLTVAFHSLHLFARVSTLVRYQEDVAPRRTLDCLYRMSGVLSGSSYEVPSFRSTSVDPPPTTIRASATPGCFRTRPKPCASHRIWSAGCDSLGCSILPTSTPRGSRIPSA